MGVGASRTLWDRNRDFSCSRVMASRVQGQFEFGGVGPRMSRDQGSRRIRNFLRLVLSRPQRTPGAADAQQCLPRQCEHK
eukprot:4738681-Pyramimonas_sp.AAC.1